MAESNLVETFNNGRPARFSFADINASVMLPFQDQGSVFPLPGLNLLSISEHRDTFPVVGMNRRGIRGFTSGPRTTAGTIGFTTLDESPFMGVLKAYSKWLGFPAGYMGVKIDELPPFYLNAVCIDNYGNASNITIRGIKIVDTAKNVSVRDIQMTEVYSFIAGSATELIKLNQVSLDVKETEPDVRTANPVQVLQIGAIPIVLPAIEEIIEAVTEPSPSRPFPIPITGAYTR